MVPFLIISGVSSLVLVVMVVALVRHVRVLAGSVQAFNREVEPVMTQIRADADASRIRLERAQKAAETLRPSDPRRPR